MPWNISRLVTENGMVCSLKERLYSRAPYCSKMRPLPLCESFWRLSWKGHNKPFLLLLSSIFTSYWNPEEMSLQSPLPGTACPYLIFSLLSSAVLEFLWKRFRGHSASMTFELGVALKAFNLSFPSLRKPGKSLRCLFSVPASLDISQDRSRLQNDKYEPNWRKNGKGCLRLWLY